MMRSKKSVMLLFTGVLLLLSFRPQASGGAERWVLGVDFPVAYKARFSVPVDGAAILLTGWQEHVGSSRVVYAVVKRNRFGWPVYYHSASVQGDYPLNGAAFTVLLQQIPGGDGYEIEITGGMLLSRGAVRVEVLAKEKEMAIQ